VGNAITLLCKEESECFLRQVNGPVDLKTVEMVHVVAVITDYSVVSVLLRIELNCQLSSIEVFKVVLERDKKDSIVFIFKLKFSF